MGRPSMRTPAALPGVPVHEGEEDFRRDARQILRRAGGGAAEGHDTPQLVAMGSQATAVHPALVPEPMVQLPAEMLRRTRRGWLRTRRRDRPGIHQMVGEAACGHGEFALHVRSARPRAGVRQLAHAVHVERAGHEATGFGPRAQAVDHAPERLDGASGVAPAGKGFQELVAVPGQPEAVRWGSRRRGRRRRLAGHHGDFLSVENQRGMCAIGQRSGAWSTQSGGGAATSLHGKPGCRAAPLLRIMPTFERRRPRPSGARPRCRHKTDVGI